MARSGCSPEHPKYVAGCTYCQATARADKARARELKASGRYKEPVLIADLRPHAFALRAAGWTTNDIARESGVSSSTIDEMFRDAPRVNRVQGHTAAMFLALEVRPLDRIRENHDDVLVPQRMVRALYALGHTMTRQAKGAGLSHHTIVMIARDELTSVRKETADAIDALYREWYTAAGTANSARTDARERGWHDPLAWHDIRDPKCKPEVYEAPPRRDADEVDWLNVRHALAGVSGWADLTNAERVIVVTQLIRRLPDVGIGQTLGTTGVNIAQFRKRWGIPAASAAVIDQWQQEILQCRRYVAPVGEVRRRHDLHEAAA